VARGLGEHLPEDARLVVDPYGLRFAERWLRFVVRHAGFFVRAFQETLVLVQVRTRFIDDVLRAFVRDGGDQIVLLGAGYDCRAHRLARELGQARVFEVDHPATQAVKRARLGEDVLATYVAWDFEARSVDELPDALAELGHRREKPTLTIWEGVAMYLSEPALDASVRAMAAYSSPGSAVVFSYVTLALVKRDGFALRLMRRLMSGSGEPMRSGFDPATLSSWLQDRGLRLDLDVSVADLVARMLPARFHKVLANPDLRFGVARRA
jgi:methyltransferase (TIGR00027 family)